MTVNPFPADGRKKALTTRRRKAIAELQLVMRRVDEPFRDRASYKWLGDGIMGASYWEAQFTTHEGDVISYQELHAIPVGTGDYLFDIADATMHIPHWCIQDAMYGDWPRPQVERMLAAELSEGDLFLIVEHLHLDDQWRGFGVEPLLMGAAIRSVVASTSPAFAIGQPSLPFWAGKAAERAVAINCSAFKQLGFRQLTKTDTWIAGDIERVGRSYAKVLRQFGMPMNPFP